MTAENQTAVGVVPSCSFCGRPVRGSDLCFLDGSPTPYHIACTYAPASAAASHGCICPPGAEATCQGWQCPRLTPLTVAAIRREALEEAARLIESQQPSFPGDGPPVMHPRLSGNREGLPYADAIRALMDAPPSAAPIATNVVRYNAIEQAKWAAAEAQTFQGIEKLANLLMEDGAREQRRFTINKLIELQDEMLDGEATP